MHARNSTPHPTLPGPPPPSLTPGKVVFSAAALCVAAGSAAAEFAFAPPVLIETPGGTADIILHDLDGDGDLDIVSLESIFMFQDGTVQGLVNILPNAGGAFGPVQTVELGTSPALEAAFNKVRAADLDGDGFTDLAFIGSTTPLSLLLADSGGTFGAPIDTGFAVSAAQLTGLVDLGDLDGDGDEDAVIAIPADLLFNEGAANFDAVDLIDDFNGDNLKVLDLDGDGDLDIAHGFRAHLNDGGGTLAVAGTYPGSGSIDCAFADFDGDGALDVACQKVGPDPEIRWALGAGDGTFAAQAPLPADDSPVNVEAADFDGDGNVDLVVTLRGPCCDPTDVVDIYAGNGGGFDAPQRIDVPSDVLMAAGDLDGDGRPDLVLATGDQFDGGDAIVIALNASGRPADLDGDGTVGINDFLLLLAAWGPCPGQCPPSCSADLDGDCNVGIGDLLALLADWG